MGGELVRAGQNERGPGRRRTDPMVIMFAVIIVIGFVVFFGFISDSFGAKNYAMPDIPTNPPHCPALCDVVDQSAPGCNVSACDYHHCTLLWYGRCINSY